jgi:ParB family transcriptional regulator, chromosome partitioning protein
MKPVRKIRLDNAQAMQAHQEAASSAAMNKFAAAEAITKIQPHGLANPVEAPASLLPASNGIVASSSNSGTGLNTSAVAFDFALCVPGSIVRVPLHLIDTNPLSPRQIYTGEEIDKIAKTLPGGQDVAAHGYVSDGRVKLIDGGTRFRAAKITDRSYLDVKIEEAPKDKLSLFRRARDLNEQRSDTSPLDFALSLQLLLREGAVATQRELIDNVEAPGGGRLSEGTVSQYLRMARMPEKVQRAMVDAEETATAGALYAVATMFEEGMDAAQLEQRQELAHEVIEEIKRRKLNKAQIVALVKSKLDGPKSRERSTVHPLAFGTHKGQIKMFSRKGKIDLSLGGLSEAEMPEVRTVLVKALEDFMARKGTASE